VLQWSILTYSVGTILSGLAPSAVLLLGARVVTGLGVGGEWAVGHALLGESVPARVRGRFGALLQTGAPAGVGLAAVVGSFVAPAIGWRATFVLSGAPALLVTAIRRSLPESDLWRRGGGAAPVARLFAPGMRGLVGLAFGLAVLNMSSYWFTYTWLPTYLTEERGLTIAGSGLRILVVVAGELIGYASFGAVSDRFGRKPAFSAYATLMAAGLVSITFLWPRIVGWPPLLLFCLWLVGFGTGTWSNFGPMFAELFPTALRTTATGSVYNAARGVQFVTPLVVTAMAGRWGLAGGIALAAGFALAAAGWVWLLPETRGRRL
jgi:MFS family permease